VFDLAAFPDWGDVAVADDPESGDEEAEGVEAEGVEAEGVEAEGVEAEDTDDEADADADEDELNWADVHEALRGALLRIAHAGENLPNPPEGSTFTMAVELRDDAPAPIGHPQPWIPSPRNLQPPSKGRSGGGSLKAASTTPVRSVQAGPLFFECWVEQSDAQPGLQSLNKSQDITSS
jgi:mitotic spindle assembly checkpoint protein MAD2B